MSPLPIGMIIEGLVAVLLLVTIGFCFTLNRRLQRLRADEETLRATISELMTATEIAERAILGLKSTAVNADQTLGARLQAAEQMSHALADQVGEGEKVFNRIGQIAEAARAATAARDAGSLPGHPPRSSHEHGQYDHGGYTQQPAAPYQAQPHSGQPYAGGQTYSGETPAQNVEQSYAPSAAAPVAPRRHGRTDHIRSAAAEATARLEQFRKRSGGAAA